MQLHATRTSGELIAVESATKGIDYFCPECHSIVHLRGGPFIRLHFYHLKPDSFCHQSKKSAEHLNVQLYLKNLLGPLCKIEHIFPAIQRIADVCDPDRKLIFEVQCSSITAEEVLARNRDYQSEGYQVIWILHDNRFCRTRTSLAEIALLNSPHYFTNFDTQGKGIIYDRLSFIQNQRRIYLSDKASVNLTCAQPNTFKVLPKFLASRKPWPLFFEGDFLDLQKCTLKTSTHPLKMWKIFLPFFLSQMLHFPIRMSQRLNSLHRQLLNFLLEQHSK